MNDKRSERLRSGFAALVLCGALFGTLLSAQPAFAGARTSLVPDPGTGATQVQADSSRSSSSARTTLDLTNADRKAHKIRGLKFDRKLSRYAAKHSKKMAHVNALYHTTNLSSKLHHRSWRVAGENVGEGASLDDINTAFMNSPEHRKNILRKSFDHAAVGVYTDGDGMIWVTVIFYG